MKTDTPAYRAAMDRNAAFAIDAVIRQAHTLHHLDSADAVQKLAVALQRSRISRSELAGVLAALAVNSDRTDEHVLTVQEPPAAATRLARVLTDIAAVDPSHHGHTGPDTPEVAARYARRNALIWTAVALASEAGIPAGVGYDPSDPRPVVAYIELPTGQVSWHLPGHQAGWDGHSTGVKYERVAMFAEMTGLPA